MRYARCLLALGLALAATQQLRAQIPVAPFPGGGSGRPLGFTYTGKSFSATIVLGGYGPYSRPQYGLPYPPGPVVGGMVLVPASPVVTRPVVVNNPPPVVAGGNGPVAPDLLDPIVVRPRAGGGAPGAMPAVPLPDAPLPGAPAGGFRPIRPEDRARAQLPAPPDKPAPKLGPARDPMPPQPPEPEADPRAEALRQVTLGKQAFLGQEYGRAQRRFQQAVDVFPRDPMSYFLLAQTQMALGRYREAVASIHAGLRLRPAWPSSGFRPIELYGANVADYAEQMDQLHTALRQSPNDPVLIFLSAYQLWFDGQKDEARPLFRRAAALVADPTFIDLFLLPGEQMVRR